MRKTPSSPKPLCLLDEDLRPGVHRTFVPGDRRAAATTIVSTPSERTDDWKGRQRTNRHVRRANSTVSRSTETRCALEAFVPIPGAVGGRWKVTDEYFRCEQVLTTARLSGDVPRGTVWAIVLTIPTVRRCHHGRLPFDHFDIMHEWDFSDRVIDNGRHGHRHVRPGRRSRPDGEQELDAPRRRLMTDGNPSPLPRRSDPRCAVDNS